MPLPLSIVQGNDALTLSNEGSLLRRQAEFFRDNKQLDKARMTGRLCLAARGTVVLSGETAFSSH
ncbi:MAG: hypothetical protein K9N47_16645 [Prosthecobacter sp.]|uniref:hypothetical protein n=1 Tax=Prosthecobacter sp. TaxID=1965333 RepID=UPI0025E998C7|nr:hypothetical protein [Prosthecobacter sp.]MCF7787761.1 hypothetical protein [Prosthecobacter sp.]